MHTSKLHLTTRKGVEFEDNCHENSHYTSPSYHWNDNKHGNDELQIQPTWSNARNTFHLTNWDAFPTFFTVHPRGQIDLKNRARALAKLREAFWQILSRQRRESVTCIRNEICEGDLVLIRLTPSELYRRRKHVTLPVKTPRNGVYRNGSNR